MRKSRDIDKQDVSTTLAKGLTVLEAVERSSLPVTIQEVAVSTGIQRLAVYRLLQTLEDRGYVRRSEDKRYRSVMRRRRVRVGYFAPLSGNQFRVELTDSIRRAAAEAGVDLLVLDNAEDDSSGALNHVQAMLNALVDAAIFFQPVESVGHMVGDALFGAGVPFITVERPIQGGVYFGANNFQAGKMAGQTLGRYAQERWRGRFDRVVLVEGPQTRTNVQARLAGVVVGLRERLKTLQDSQVLHLEGRAHQDSSRKAMRELLRKLAPGSRLLVSAFNDLSALGAMDAVCEVGRERDVAIVGHNASQEGRAAIRRKNSCFIASVAFFPERYGNKLMKLACSIADGEPVPPAVYTDHVVLHAGNIDSVYPETVHIVNT